MQTIPHDVGTCNTRPNQHQVDDLLWQADEHERLAREREANEQELASDARFGARLPERYPLDAAPTQRDWRTWVETREDAIAGELVALWTRSRELTTELLRLWSVDETEEEAAQTLRSPSAGDPRAAAATNAGWSAFACGESYLGSPSEREREVREDWLCDERQRELSEVMAP